MSDWFSDFPSYKGSVFICQNCRGDECIGPHFDDEWIARDVYASEFAAIRRAAQYARDLHTKHGWEVLEANVVRAAIRHAINSPKAGKW